MNHELSLSCYLSARQDPTVDPGVYQDLEHLVHLFGLLDQDPGGGQREALPSWKFVGPAPSLLIVEDESGLVDMLKLALVGVGYPEMAIYTCVSGEEATAFVEKQAVGIAFVDIKLASRMAFRGAYLSGLHVARAIKETSPGAKVILISGFGTAQMVRKAILELGVSYYLGKPFRQADLLRLVHWAVEQVMGTHVRDVVLGKKGPDSDRGRRLGAETILVVDDDSALAEGLALALRERGYEAVTAISGREAVQKVHGMAFDAVLLDVRMPDLDGLEVLRRIREQQPELPVVILTGVQDESVAQEVIRLGAQSFLTKPCDIGLLQVSLEYAWAQRQIGGYTS